MATESTPTPQPGLLGAPAPVAPPLQPVGLVAQRIARTILGNATVLYTHLARVLIEDFAAVWQPVEQGLDAQGQPVTVTPQMILDAMRDNQGRPAAAAMVIGHALLSAPAEQVRQLYGAAGSTPIPLSAPAGWTITPNADGTATIAAAPAPAPAP